LVFIFLLKKKLNSQNAVALCFEPTVKPIISVQVARLAPKSVLETTNDVENYVESLRQALLAEIQRNQRVRLE
jgi:hypothetical protein